MRRLTVEQVKNEHGGKLPADAVLIAPEGATPPPPAKNQTRPVRGRGERFAILNAFIDFTQAGLKASEVRTWLVLFRDTKAVTGIAETGETDIARRSGLCRRAVQLALKSLEAKGLIRVVRRGRLNVGVSAYRVHPTGNA